MPTNFWFKQIKVENFRGLKDFQTGKLRRVNVIGGLNGAGKTTLLEALFSSVDWRSPIFLVKPAMWRQLPATLDFVNRFSFSDSQKEKPMLLFTETRSGRFETSVQFDANIILDAAIIPTNAEVSSNISAQGLPGIIVKVFLNGEVADEAHYTDAATGIMMNKKRSAEFAVPTCAYISKATLTNSADNSTRFSNVVERRLKSRILSVAQLTSPWVADLQLLQIGESPQLCATTSDETIVPLSMLGDGTLTLLTIAMAIIQCADGAVLLDEFDTAIHYSLLKKVWSEIAVLANEYNCQIFAATHSRECIAAAYEGLASANLSHDLNYMRLDRSDDGHVSATSYSPDELKGALAENWEVR